MDFDKKKIQSILRYSIFYFFIIKHLSLYISPVVLRMESTEVKTSVAT